MNRANGFLVVAIAAVVLVGCGSQIEGPEPPEPSVCECPELLAYVTSLPEIGGLFGDGEIVIHEGDVKVRGEPAGPGFGSEELLAALDGYLPQATVQENIISMVDWVLLLNPNPDSNLGSFIAFPDIEGADQFAGINEPDNYDHRAIADLQQRAIERLSDLESALRAVAAGG